MKKIIKKWGDSNVIVLDREDSEIYELNIGDIVDIEIMKIRGVKKEGDNKKKIQR